MERAYHQPVIPAALADDASRYPPAHPHWESRVNRLAGDHHACLGLRRDLPDQQRPAPASNRGREPSGVASHVLDDDGRTPGAGGSVSAKVTREQGARMTHLLGPILPAFG